MTRGGKSLLRKRNNLDAAGITESQWRRQWESSRMFLTADGEKDKDWGNETIRWNPQTKWLEIKLPAPLGHLANQPHGRYRLSATVEFSYRGGEVAAQAATGAIRYDITRRPHPSDPARDRWYIDASWKMAPRPAPSIDELRQNPVVAIDVNHSHLAVAVVAPDGNILGNPSTIGLDLDDLSATMRDGRLRAAISGIIATAKAHGAHAIVIENLDFAKARAEGRERHGNRFSRGSNGRGFRRKISGIPTARFRDRVVQMGYNAGLSIVAVDPAYTSRWAAQHWLRPLREHHQQTTGHHAAALVIGRRGLGHRARRCVTGNQAAPAEAARRAQARPQITPGTRERTQETCHPTRSPAALRHQDRTTSQGHGRDPGSPRPFGAAGLQRTMSG